MRTGFFVVVAATIALLLSCGSASVKIKIVHSPNAQFFLANNPDVADAIQSYAEMLCLQDNVKSQSPNAILEAGMLCEDSKRDSDGDSLNHDGKWHEYAYLAYVGIVAMCAADEQLENLCKGFK